MLVVIPVILVLLHLRLGFTQTFIEFFDVLLWVEQLTAISDLLQVLCYFFVEFLGLNHEHFLD